MDFFTGSAKNSPEVGLFPFPVFRFSKKWPISLEFQPEVVLFPPEVSCFFKIFKASRASVAKSWWKWGPKLAKMLKNGNGSWFSLENQIFQGFTSVFWQKVAEFGNRKRKWGPKLLKNHVFWKKTALFHKKYEIYKIFHPQTGNTRLLLRFYVTIFSIFKQNKQKFFF